MPVLGAGSPLPRRPQRVLVAGTSGSGKSTLAQRIAGVLDLPYSELDALQHGPGWTALPSFADDVARLAAGDAWVTEWQYARVRELLLSRADCLVWLDLPRWTVMAQVIGRTVRRRLRRQRLWQGNVEPPLRTLLTDRDHIVRWAWRTHPRTRLRMLDVIERRSDLTIVRLVDRGAVSAWVAGPLSACPDP